LTEEWKAARGDVGCQGRPTKEKPNSGEGFSLQRAILAVVLRDENYQDMMEPIKLMLGDSSEITGHAPGGCFENLAKVEKNGRPPSITRITETAHRVKSSLRSAILTLCVSGAELAKDDRA